MSSVVSTDHLTKDFLVGFWRPRPHRALSDLSFEIHRGDVFGLLGPNGAGKSTTLKLLTNLIWPTAGRATVLGASPGDVAARQRLGFLPEQPTFYDHLTAEELVSYFAGLFGYTGADRRAKAARALDTVGLGADRTRPLRQYSKGMIQRVGLAQALVNDPELVILDEPMSGLDPLGRREVREIILRLRDEGRTILFSSHILSDAEWLCNRVAILSRGRLAALGAVADLVAANDAGGVARGSEIVVSGLAADVADLVRARVARVTHLGNGRYAIEVAAGVRPEPVVAELAAKGATLVSVTPLRASLEDVFVASVSASDTAGEPDSAVRPR
jgi:ABC-2 type transport system ATP-binding protein